MLNPIPDYPLGLVAVANEMCRLIQLERKNLGFNYTDYASIYFCPNEDMMSAVSCMKKEMEEETRSVIKYDFSLKEDKRFTVDVDERLQILPASAPRRVINYGLRINKCTQTNIKQ